MRQVNIHEAKIHLSRLIEDVSLGEEIVIAKAGTPVARLVAIEPVRPPRRPGSLKGKIWLTDDFDSPLPAEVIAAFEGIG